MKEKFDHPYDTPVSSALRFSIEVIAWVAGPWAATEVSTWLAIPVAAVLIALPAVFSTQGDKRQVVVATPGPARVLIELFLHTVAIASPWAVWPAWLAALTTLAVVAALAVGVPRLKWLLSGARPV